MAGGMRCPYRGEGHMSDEMIVGRIVLPATVDMAPALPMTPEQQRTKGGDITRDLIKAMAADIGKSLIAYIEVMYPEAIRATSSTFKTSMKNHVYNDIMSIVELHDEAAIRKRLAANEAHRKEWLKQWRTIRKMKRRG